MKVPVNFFFRLSFGTNENRLAYLLTLKAARDSRKVPRFQYTPPKNSLFEGNFYPKKIEGLVMNLTPPVIHLFR